MGAPKNFSPNDWLTSAEATEYLGLSHSHLSVLRSRGNGPLYTNVAPEGAALSTGIVAAISIIGPPPARQHSPRKCRAGLTTLSRRLPV